MLPLSRRLGVGLAAGAVFSSGLVATLSLTASTATAAPVLSTADTTWRYLENDTFPSAGSADPVSWTKPAFDDSAWKSGKGSFGGKISGSVQSPAYDSSRTATTQLEMNAPGASTRVRTYFFRADLTLTAEQLKAAAAFKGSVAYDDGIIVYVNGTEVLRGDVPAGQEGLNYATGPSTSLDTSDFVVPKELLVAGANTLAVEVHNDRATSSDIWFDLTALEAQNAEQVAAKPTRIILTPTDDATTSQNITFQGADEADTVGRIEIKPAAGGAVKAVKAPLQPGSVSNAFGHFSGTVTGLKPGTEYSYRVASNNKWSAWSTFETADPSETDFSYLYYGDAQIGLDTTWPTVVNAAMAKAPDAVGSVHAGDLIDTSSNDVQWQNWFKGMESAAATTNVMAAPGNHEYSGDKLMTSWKAHFEYPHNNPNDSTIGEMAALAQGEGEVAKQYRAYFDHWSDFAAETVYFADYQGVRFITVNATRDTTFLKPDVLPACTGTECPSTKVAELWTQYQAAWLDHVLTESKATWNVVTFHQPVYSTSAGRNEPVLRQYWVPVFEKHNIDLVQMGHDHTYARGYKDDTATATPGITDGPVYIVSNSGAKHYALETDAKNVWTLNGATQVQKAANVTTYQVVDVTGDTLTYRSYIAEINGSGQFYKNGQQVDSAQYKVGDLWDTFTVHKSASGEKAVTEAGIAAPVFPDLTPAPVITQDLPATTEVLPGEPVTLSVRASADRALTYQWQKRTASGDWTDVSGATREELALGAVPLRELGTAYRVAVSAGTKTTTSTPTTLTDAAGAPAFVTDLPRSVSVASGSATVLRVNATANAPVSYQWQRRTTGAWQNLTGRTGAVLELDAVRGQTAQYRVVATAGTRSTVSSAATVRAVQRVAAASITRLQAKPGKPVVVTVRSDVAGTATVTGRAKGLRASRTVVLRPGVATKVNLGKLPRTTKLTRGKKAGASALAKRKARATVAVTASLQVTPHGLDHRASAKVTRTVRVR